MKLPSALAHAASLGAAQDVIVRFDAERGHDWRTLMQAADFAKSIGARLAIEAIFNAVDPQAEASGVVDAIRSANVEPGAVLISPRREFKTRPSNMLPSGECDIGELVDALRTAGLKASIGAGTPSFFTEFNRNPPTGDCDFVFFGVAGNVHAADDLSVMETLSVYPAVIASARKLCPGKPLWLGPCTIGMRHNPYGATVAANPAHVRLPAAGDDPRHRRAVRRGLRRRRGSAGCRSRRRPPDPGRADRPFRTGDRAPARVARFKRFTPSSQGGQRRVLCRDDRSAGPGSRRLPRRLPSFGCWLPT